MRTSLFTILPLLLFSASVSAQLRAFDAPVQGFVSWTPAPTWEEGLLSGNGEIGAVVFGRPHDETIIVNHAQLFLPARVPMKPIGQGKRLDEIRQLLAEGKYEEAARIPVDQSMAEGYGEQHWIDPLVPFCDIRVQMEPGNVDNYRRMVDFTTGEAKVEWVQDGQLFQRSLFVSRADSMLVMAIRSSGKINCTLQLVRHEVPWSQWSYINSNIKGTWTSADGRYLTYRTEFVHKWGDNPHGFEGVARLEAPGGEVSGNGNQIDIHGATEVLLTMKVKPGYDTANSPIPLLKSQLDAKPFAYDTLCARHKQIHGDLFGRVKLNLGDGGDAGLQSEALVLKARKNVSNAIVQKQFDAARYHIISSVGINPPTLQGIWSGTWTPPWSSGFTHDGNVEVAVSALLSTRTPELMKAYMGYHERMMPHYRENAQKLFGCRGIVLPAHSSSHGWVIHFDKTWCLSYWTGGAGWTAGILYDYFLYTGDKAYLAQHIYPFMKEGALFYEDFLFKGKDGKFVFSPSYSPENNPLNSTSQACVDATMDVMIAKELLRNCIEAGKLLGESGQQLQKWAGMLKLMPGYRINSDGALAEWIPDGMEDNYHHRHVSHLYALYERVAPEFKADTKLMDAANMAVEKRMFHRRLENGGEMVFGLAQLGMVTANLGDRGKTAEIIDWMSRYYWTPLLATYHNSGSLFNMDMSGGFPAVIMRALAYSEPGLVKLLPALPEKWETGSVEGMALRGQLTLSRMAWNPQKIEVAIVSAINQKVALQLPSPVASFTASNANAAKAAVKGGNMVWLSLTANQPLTLNILLK
ncbi:MAG: glycoside hydrolase N-terminal domain-containing protein [Breznakibacter sp.]